MLCNEALAPRVATLLVQHTPERCVTHDRGAVDHPPHAGPGAGGAMHHPPVVPQGELTNTLVVMKFFHLFFIRNLYGTSLTWRTVRGTPAVWLTVATVTLAQVAITYVPWLQVVFDTRAVPLADGVLIISVGVALFVIIAIEKQVRLAFANRAAPAGAGCA